MNDQKLQKYDSDAQKAWNLLSAHNSELQLEVQLLRKQIERMSIMGLIKAKVRLTLDLWLGRKKWWEIE